MHRYTPNILALGLLYCHGVMSMQVAQLAIEWCLDHPEAEAGYAQCISKVVCQPSFQASETQAGSAACVSYGECDCSKIEDKNCHEYYQCISNPNCAACTLPDITTVPVTTSTYELETLAPGTYTLTMSGTTKTAVVPLATFTITDFTTTVTATSTLTLTVTKDTTAKTTSVEIPSYKTIASTTIPDATKVSTVTATSVLTMTVTSTSRSTTGSISPTPTAPPTCPSYCDCKPKYGDPDAFESCLKQPECAGCGIPFPPLPDPIPEPATTKGHNSTTTTSAKPTPSCAAWCDCSKIDDKKSDAYFQCITDPGCERCLIGGRRISRRVHGK